MNKTCFLGILLGVFFNLNAQVYLAKNVNVRLFSAAPLENIEAKSTLSSCAFNAKNNRIVMKVPIKSFKFDRALMEEHFNENYLESDKYPVAEFNGSIEDVPDFTKDGTYSMKIKGKLTIHGVTNDREYVSNIVVKNGDISGTVVFKVKCEDYKIDIPKIVIKNIAEEIEISVNADFKLMKK